MTRRHAIITIFLLFVSTIISVLWTACNQEKQEVIRIGAIIPLSGYAAKYGGWIKEAIELIREEVNEKGGIRGYKLEIIYEDDAADPTKAATAMSKLANIDKVPAVIGSWASSSVLAQAPIANRTKTIIMALGASPKISDAGDYVFRAAPDARLPLNKLIPYLVNQGNRTIVILYINNDFGKDQADVFRHAFERSGGTVPLSEGYDASSTDFRTYLIKAMEFRADGIFLAGYAEVGRILKQARELAIDTHFYSSFPFENTDVLELAGDAAEGVIYPHFFDPESNVGAMKEYQRKYFARYGRPSEGFAAEAYNGMLIIVEVMKQVGFSPEAIKEELYLLQEFPGLFGEVSFNDKGDINMPMLIKTVRSGAFTVVME